MSDELLTINKLCELLSVSRSTVLRLRKGICTTSNVRFPEPTMRFHRGPRWTLSSINAWIALNEALNLKCVNEQVEIQRRTS